MRLKLSAAVLPLALAGCAVSPIATPTAQSGISIQGKVHGGQQAIVGAHVYLFAANTTGYGNASVSLLTSVPGSTQLDNNGGPTNGDYYTTTASDGSFSITNDYTCTPNTQVYLYSLGGNPGAGTNGASSLMAVLGNCPGAGNFLVPAPFIWLNEVSTVAAAYAMSGYAVDATHVSSSGSPLALIGIANAFANAANLETLSTGVALTATPSGNAVAPQMAVNTVANILSSCINSNGAIAGPASPSPCYTLFNNAIVPAGQSTPAIIPADTASAAINIAHLPNLNVGALYSLATPAAPFAPALTVQPADYTLSLTYSGGALSSPIAIAIDGLGNAYIANHSGSSITEISVAGTYPFGANGFTSGGLSSPTALAVDRFNRVWVADYSSSSVAEISSTGTLLSPANGYTASNSLNQPYGIAIDASSQIWITDYGTGMITRLQANGAVNGFYSVGSLNKPYAIAIDGSGNAWITMWQNDIVTELTNTGTLVGNWTGSALDSPESIAIDNGGNAWASNYIGNSVTQVVTGGTLTPNTNTTLNKPESVAVDGGGNVWAANYSGNTVTNLGNLFAYTAAGLNEPDAVAIDGSGNVWIANTGIYTVTEMIGAAVPVVTPLAVGVFNNTLGTRP